MAFQGAVAAWALHTIHLVHIDASFGLEDLNDQRQPHGNFRGRDRNHKEHKDLAAETLQDAAEGDKRQVRGI